MRKSVPVGKAKRDVGNVFLGFLWILPKI